MKLNTIILFDLRPEFQESPTRAPDPAACSRGLAGEVPASTHPPHPETFQGAHTFHWNKFMSLEACGQFGKFAGDINLIPQILVDNKGKTMIKSRS